MSLKTTSNQSWQAPDLFVHLNNKHTFPETWYAGLSETWGLASETVKVQVQPSGHTWWSKKLSHLSFPEHTKKKVTSQVVGRLRRIKRSSLNLGETTIVFVSSSHQKASEKIRSGQGLSNRTCVKPEHRSRTHPRAPTCSTCQQQAIQASAPLLCFVFLRNPLQCPEQGKALLI